YQEQVQLIAQKVAGYSLGKADMLRKAMGKKKKEVLDAEFVPFSQGMLANGYSEAAVKTLWDILVPFSDYAFNKAHTAAYGLISYWTAYLKANYPAEYMAALLTSVRDDKDKSALYLNECRRMGIKVLPPDVNESAADFTAVGTDIRFGLGAVRNIGINVVQSIIETRLQKGSFKSFEDFLTKAPVVRDANSAQANAPYHSVKIEQVLNKRAIESLIRAGAFDSLGHSRKGLLSIHSEYVDAVGVDQRSALYGQDALFGVFDSSYDVGEERGINAGLRPIPLGEWDKSTLLAFEREMLGLYVSDHPLFGIEHVLSQHADTSIAALTGDDTLPDGASVTVAGLITGLQIKRTKKGDLWAIATVEDLDGAIEAMFFPSTYQAVAALLAQDLVCVVRGRLNRREETPSIYAQELILPDIKEGPRGPVLITMTTARATRPMVERIKSVLVEHPGVVEVQLKLTAPGRSVTLRLDDSLRVNASPSLFGDLKAILPSGSVSA
ncbi:MAG TPA: OB-fold nucleic acid binding domain-containing protein, partial [Dermatophilaceae bacterium]|nr:OB-fold nucleic acid binding domain-containing protein [Dermatophilaceae bacterium]